MKISKYTQTGLSFGLTSGVITTLGLIVGLNSGTHSRLAVIGGILTIAIADAMSDALGIHISEETRAKKMTPGVWAATLSTFLAKFTFAITFAIPVLLLPLETAVLASIAWGLSLIILTSYLMSKQQKQPALAIILEHLTIALIVIIATYYTGHLVNAYFT